MLTPLQKNLIIGSCLGDAHVERNGKNCRLRFPHAQKRKALVCWKHTLLFPHALSVVEYSPYDKRTKKTYYKARFDTTTNNCFNEFRDIFYEQREKIVLHNIAPLLYDPLALAVRYLDDGALRVECKAFRLHTNSYTFHDVQLLRDVLRENFYIESTLHRQQAISQSVR